MKTLGIIPARHESSRFPGKPLADINGKSMIQRVYEQCSKAKSLNKVVVATDDKRIFNHVTSFGGEVMMTSDKHQSGTDRCGEVLLALEDEGEGYDVMVNIQGDEPFIDPKQIDLICSVFELDPTAEIATLVKRIQEKEELFNPNVVKAVLTEKEENTNLMDALYFSRQTIPYLRGVEDEEHWLMRHKFYKHIGIYGFNVEEFYGVLELKMSTLEQAESLEQLRWLENHYTVQALETTLETFGIDSPEDLEKAKAYL